MSTGAKEVFGIVKEHCSGPEVCFNYLSNEALIETEQRLWEVLWYKGEELEQLRDAQWKMITEDEICYYRKQLDKVRNYPLKPIFVVAIQ